MGIVADIQRCETFEDRMWGWLVVAVDSDRFSNEIILSLELNGPWHSRDENKACLDVETEDYEAVNAFHANVGSLRVMDYVCPENCLLTWEERVD